MRYEQATCPRRQYISVYSFDFVECNYAETLYVKLKETNIEIHNDVLFCNIYLDRTRTKLITYILFVRKFLSFFTPIHTQCPT